MVLQEIPRALAVSVLDNMDQTPPTVEHTGPLVA
jgi:hypothetical protein